MEESDIETGDEGLESSGSSLARAGMELLEEAAGEREQVQDGTEDKGQVRCKEEGSECTTVFWCPQKKSMSG